MQGRKGVTDLHAQAAQGAVGMVARCPVASVVSGEAVCVGQWGKPCNVV